MIHRRDLLIGAACLAAAGGAEAMRPRERLLLLHGAKLDAAIPHRFGQWQMHDTDALVTPQSEDSLSAKLYSQIVGRVYSRPDGNFVMLLIAYGDTQNDLLQLHRPEVCYPAFGFQVTESKPTEFALAPGVNVPGRNLTATSASRDERISYWTRIGEYLPIDNGQQREMKLMTALHGIIPDGVLVRISNTLPDDEQGYALNKRFAGDMIAAIPPAVRPALITTEKARQLAAQV